jgi:hypothetical protein
LRGDRGQARLRRRSIPNRFLLINCAQAHRKLGVTSLIQFGIRQKHTRTPARE